MADPVDHFPAMLSLIGTLSGSAIGFAVGFVGQWFLEGRRQKFEKQKQEAERQKEIKRKKAEKLEELAHYCGNILTGLLYVGVIRRLTPKRLLSHHHILVKLLQ
jgi:membrane protein YqaA with SNARE-associated domain